MTLTLHKGGEIVTYNQLKAVPTPDPTDSHYPLPHSVLVDMVKYALGYFGHEVIEEHHALDKDGARYFGLMTLRSPDGQYTDTLGMRNSHDRTLPVGLAYGALTFVCDNLSFHGDFVLKRKHTPKVKFELPGLVSELIEPLATRREAQQKTFALYRATLLSDRLADHAIMSMYRQGIINVQRIADVLEQWQRPAYDWGPPSAWSLFNAATYTLTGRVSENPSATASLHRILDGVCHTVQ